ncbi:sporulation protein RMD1 [Xylariaceae sp. FL0016]|nr:sporulation protein RMD1 [Xylariaceae sp. FL0016]
MPFKKHNRQYDIIVFGASGYTGLMTAEYIATHLPTDLKWAVAGRSAQKLKNVVQTCNSISSDRTAPAVEICSLNDVDLAALAKKTFVLIATVGPYSQYGEPAFKACAENGTHYIDCTGEVAWQWDMIKKYNEAAKVSGACLFPQSGVESAPSDLMTLSMASLVNEELSAPVKNVVVEIHELSSAPSGGTLATVLGLFESFSLKELAACHKPFALSPVRNPKPDPKAPLLSRLTGCYNVPDLGLLSTSITSGTNKAIVERTWGLFQLEPRLQKYTYGPNFSFREYMKARNWVGALAMHYALLISFTFIALCAPLRSLIRRFIFQPGQGPSREDSAKDYIEFRGTAIPDQSKPSQKALCKAWFSGSLRKPSMVCGCGNLVMASPRASTSSAGFSTERTPLIRQDTARPRSSRNVTFNPNPVSRTIEPDPASLSTSPANSITNALDHVRSSPSAALGGGSQPPPPMLSALNSRLKRRNSHGAVFTALPPAVVPKIGPQRSSKNAQKLKLLPNPELEEAEQDEESGRDVYSQYTRIKDPMARRDAARLGKADRDRLPRVTAYCTANRYNAEGLIRFLKGRSKARGSNPKLIDECIYSPYNYGTGKSAERAEAVAESRERSIQSYERRHSTGGVDEHSNSYQREALANYNAAQQDGTSDYNNGRDAHHNLTYTPHPNDENAIESSPPPHRQPDPDFDIQVHTPEVFLFDYGVVVIWGMSPAHEQRFLKDIAKFEIEKLDSDDVETECFNFYYTRDYQPRIYNDFITLRDKGNYMTKLAISHALAQSVKTSLFEELIASTVDTCKDIPTQIALTGKINLPRQQINMQIGELFILRINIHLNGSVLDTPELFWVEPHLEPVYQAVRSYLEMDQRVGLLTERLDVIADLLAVLKDQLSHGHGEMLEWIVIVLIAAEILVAAVNIVVDLYAGVD